MHHVEFLGILLPQLVECLFVLEEDLPSEDQSTNPCSWNKILDSLRSNQQ